MKRSVPLKIILIPIATLIVCALGIILFLFSHQDSSNDPWSKAIQDEKTIQLTDCTPDLSALPVFCDKEYYELTAESASEYGADGTPAEDGLRVRIYDTLSGSPFMESSLISVSPSGETFLYGIDHLLAIVKNDEITIVTTSDLEYYGIEEDTSINDRINVVWSPDETLCAILYPSQTAAPNVYASLYKDLMLINAETGNLSYVVRYAPGEYEGEIESACFSADGKILYYFDSYSEGPYGAVKECNLLTGAQKTLCRLEDNVATVCPDLCLDAEGKLRSLAFFREKQTSAPVIFTPSEEAWEAEILDLPSPGFVAPYERYLYSPQSQTELLLKVFNNYPYLARANASGSLSALLLPIDGNQALSVDVNGEELQEASQEIYTAALPTKLLPVSAALSPSGGQVLITTSWGHDSGLYLLDLESLCYCALNVPVDVKAYVDPDELLIDSQPRKIAWLADDRIMVPTVDGNRIYQMEIAE